MDSILTSVKELLGMNEEYESFDNDVIIFTNATIAKLTFLGVGPSEGFRIKDSNDTWDDYLDEGVIRDLVKEYLQISVKLKFDPPASATILQAYQETLKNDEFYLTIGVEEVNRDE